MTNSQNPHRATHNHKMIGRVSVQIFLLHVETWQSNQTFETFDLAADVKVLSRPVE